MNARKAANDYAKEHAKHLKSEVAHAKKLRKRIAALEESNTTRSKERMFELKIELRLIESTIKIGSDPKWIKAAKRNIVRRTKMGC